MLHTSGHLAALTALTLGLVGCAQPLVATSPATMPLAQRAVQALATADSFLIKDTAPYRTLAVAPLPKGPHFQLEFNRKGNAGNAQTIFFADGVPFELRFVVGAGFRVLDSDAADGVATLQAPAGSFDSYFASKGKPVGQLQLIDPTYFAKATLASVTGTPSYVQLGLRQVELPASWRRGASFVLKLNPQGLEGVSSRWFASSAAAPVPPVPPAIQGVQGPAEVLPGRTAGYQALATDLNGDVLTYGWTVASGRIEGQGASVNWVAPRPAGLYAFGLTVEDAYFVTSIAPVAEVMVPNLPPVVAPLAPVGVDTFPAELVEGTTLALQSSATDENEDVLGWSWTASGGSIQGDAGQATFTAPSVPGAYVVTATVTDGEHLVSVTHTVSVVAKPAATNHGNHDGQQDDHGPDTHAVNNPNFDDLVEHGNDGDTNLQDGTKSTGRHNN